MESTDAPATIAERYRRGEQVPNLLTGATTYLAHDDVLDREVLVVLPQVPDAGRALDAARRAALVTEPELVKVLDVGDDGAVSYVVLDAPGGTALPLVAGREALEGAAARAAVGPLAAAVDVARRRGVHHGDIRPNLVFLTDHGPRLLGLGLAGALVAEADDAAPADADVAARIDTRGLVEVLYACVTGHEVTTPVVPAVDVRPDVPADLDAIITATLVEHTGPRTPQELADRLMPWRPEDLAATLQHRESPGETAPEDDAVPSPAPVQRTSVMGSTSRMPVATATPGTPPPAPGARVHRWSGVAAGAAGAAGGAAAAAGAVGGAAAGGAPLPPSFPPSTGGAVAASAQGPVPGLGPVPAPPSDSSPPAVPAPATGSAVRHTTARAVASDLRDVKKRAHRFRFNPTPVVLIVTVAALGWAAVWAGTSLTHGMGPFMTSSSQSPDPSAPADASDTPAQTGDEPTPTKTYDPPVIAKGQQLDPDGDDNEHPELVDRAFDQDLQSYWTTRTYGSAAFGGIDKRGIGYALTLEEPTQVSKIYLTTDSKGGKVEIRDTTPKDPTGGTLLASGAFDGDFSMTFDKPVVTDHLVIWITELPQTSDGKFVVHLYEVSLS